MKFVNEYKRIKNNYCSLSLTGKLITWARFKTTPVSKLLDLVSSQGKLLDLGCGFGVFSYFFAFKYPNLNIIGIDCSEHRIKLAEKVFSKPLNLRFYRGKIDDLTERDFDTTLLIDVIYLLSQKELIRTLNICYKKAKPGGVLIIKTMNKDHFFRYLFSISAPLLINWILSPSCFFPKKMRKMIIKTFGSRKKIPRFYHPRELIKIIGKQGWQVIKVFDLPLKFFWYPNIIYFCKKK